MNEITNTIAEQVRAKELHFAKFKLVSDDKNDAILINKRSKTLKVRYDSGSDTYEVTEYTFKNFEVKSEKSFNNVYCDDLMGWVESFFKFEYVMHNFVR